MRHDRGLAAGRALYEAFSAVEASAIPGIINKTKGFRGGPKHFKIKIVGMKMRRSSGDSTAGSLPLWPRTLHRYIDHLSLYLAQISSFSQSQAHGARGSVSPL